MSLWKIAWRNIQQRSLSSLLTGLSVALGVALVVTVLVIFAEVDRSFRRVAEGYDIIVGRGGRLEIVLSTVYHLGSPTENLPWTYYTEFLNTPEKKGSIAPYVDVAVPYCLGDNYQGYRVVGTTRDLFNKLGYGLDAAGQVRKYEFTAGRPFRSYQPFEGVVGALVARRTGLKVGDTFAPTHGISDEGDGHVHDPFKVVGILAPTGTPNDRAIFINIEGFFLIPDHAKDPAAMASAPHHHEHDHAGHNHSHGHVHEPLPPEQREVTAILVRSSQALPGGLAGMQVEGMVNKGEVAQAVFPSRTIAQLMEGIVSNVQKILLILAVLVVIVASVGIMVSIYNSMSDRRRDIAVMRSLGASRNTVMVVILLESVLLSLVGGIAGVLLGHGLIAALGPYIISQTGVSIGFLRFVPYELILIPGLIGLASLVGYLPAMAAYRTDVAKALTAAP